MRLKNLTFVFLFVSASTIAQKIVVLGSSVAEGAGASCTDSSWVGRLKQYFKDKKEVINLAKSDYTTYQMLPHGTVCPTDRPKIDSARNITTALALSPEILIIAMTTNDISLGYGINEYFRNLDIAINEAKRNKVKHIYIATSVPNGNANDNKRHLLFDQRNIIIKKYPFAIDIWGILEGDGFKPKKETNSGDNLHPNNAGHRLIFEEVLKSILATSNP